MCTSKHWAGGWIGSRVSWDVMTMRNSAFAICQTLSTQPEAGDCTSWAMLSWLMQLGYMEIVKTGISNT